jgi:hypothetical protein
MKIYTPKNREDVIITLSPLEYRRLYQIIEDHSCEYGSKGDMIFEMLESMEKFNNREDENYGNGS